MTNQTRSISELVESLGLSAEMLADGAQANLTELWHSEVVKDAAKDCADAKALIERLLEAIAEAREGLKLAIGEADSWIHDQFDRTGVLDNALAEIEPAKAILAKLSLFDEEGD